MILADINVLVYAFRESAPEHARYAGWLQSVVAGREPLLLVDLVLVGFIRIVTNPRIVEPVATSQQAMTFVDALLESPRSPFSHSSAQIWERVGSMIREDPQIKANLVPDAYLAAVALTHGARIATRDRGFGRFPGLRWFDPAKEASER